MLTVGTVAPDFSLLDQNGVAHTLSEYRGKTLVLYFYPKDSTSGCTKQACEFSRLAQEYAQKGAVIVGVTTYSRCAGAGRSRVDDVAGVRRLERKEMRGQGLDGNVENDVCDRSRRRGRARVR